MPIPRIEPVPTPDPLRVTPAAPASSPPLATALAYWIALLALAAIWLATLAGRSLISADEGRYASISLAMLQSGDWITPRLNGLLYFEKPPLQYWAGAASMALFGVNEFAARLWPGLAGLVMVLLPGYTAARLWGHRAGVRATLLGLGTTWIILNSHFLSLDAGLSAALTLVLCGVLLAQAAGTAGQPNTQARWMLAAWGGMGLAIMSKGLIGLLIPGAVLVLHSLWRLDASIWRRLNWLPGVALLLAITLPWFIAVSLRNPGFAEFFFIHEHFQRYLSNVHQREGAWWYFVPYLVVGFLPWTSALPWLLVPRRSDFARSWLWLWAVFIFAFFSASGSKLPSYILPIFPALVLLLTRATSALGQRFSRWHLAVPVLLWACAGIAATQAERFYNADTPQAAIDALARGLGIGSVLFLVAAALAWATARKGRLTTALGLVAVAHAAATLIVMASHDTFGQLKSSAGIVKALAPQIDAQTPVFSVRSYEQTMPFYLGRSTVLVDYVDEFAFGETHEATRWIPTLAEFTTRWQREPRAAAYMGPDTFAELQRMKLPMRVVFEDSRRIVVVKP